LFLLDYDGTLVGFFKSPGDAGPDEGLIRIIDRLAADPKNELVIISGRKRETLTHWMGRLPVNLVAEHSAAMRRRGQDWVMHESLSTEWIQSLRPIFDLYVDRTPGSLMEDKSYSLVWHCRNCEPDLARVRMHELKDALTTLTSNIHLGVYEGNKVIEVKPIDMNKGTATETWLAERPWDFVFAAGDDYTDEDMFAVLPPTAYSLKLGQGVSKARFQLDTPEALRVLLSELADLSRHDQT
jgi:trehalose 6-phosphate synthase/phosphatase